MGPEPILSGEEIKKLVSHKLEAYENLSILEQYAMFIGKAQILEFGLKRLLARKYSVPLGSVKRWTLGRVKNELEQKGLRPDFIALLHSVVEYRNYIAHELLANNALVNSIVAMNPRMEAEELWKGTYELEQIIILYDWCEENDAWD